MKKPRSTLNLVILLLATSLPMTWLAWRLGFSSVDRREDGVAIKLQIDGGKEQVNLVQNADGSFSYLVDESDGTGRLTPDELAQRLYTQEQSRDWVARLFNISSPLGFIWVGIGLLGQVLFTGRMIVQWLATEKNRQSVVPAAFWWMSLIGAMMLLTYFLWRRDIVGVLGQSFGLIVYIRNLYFIYGADRFASALEDPAPEPELRQPVASRPDDALNT